MSKRIPLTQGKFAIVDDDKYEWLNKWKWYADKGGNTYYAVRNLYLGGGRKNPKRKKIWMHRQILNTPEDKDTDHINRNGLDNRLCNIRTCSRAENLHNQKTRSGTSKYKGVSWSRDCCKWMARICKGHKQIYLGCFDDEAQAACAYDNKATELFGE